MSTNLKKDVQLIKKVQGKEIAFQVQISFDINPFPRNCGIKIISNIGFLKYSNFTPIFVNNVALPFDSPFGNNYLEATVAKVNKLITEDDLELIIKAIIENVWRGQTIVLSDSITTHPTEGPFSQVSTILRYLYLNQDRWGSVVLGDACLNINHISTTEALGNHFVQVGIWIPKVFDKRQEVKVNPLTRKITFPKLWGNSFNLRKKTISEIKKFGCYLVQAPPSPSALDSLGDLFPNFPPKTVTQEESVKPKETPGKPAKENEKIIPPPF